MRTRSREANPRNSFSRSQLKLLAPSEFHVNRICLLSSLSLASFRKIHWTRGVRAFQCFRTIYNGETKVINGTRLRYKSHFSLRKTNLYHRSKVCVQLFRTLQDFESDICKFKNLNWRNRRKGVNVEKFTYSNT